MAKNSFVAEVTFDKKVPDPNKVEEKEIRKKSCKKHPIENKIIESQKQQIVIKN